MRTLDETFERARSLKPVRVLIAVGTFPFLAIGFVLGVLVRAVWFVAAFCWAAAVVGFRKGRG